MAITIAPQVGVRRVPASSERSLSLHFRYLEWRIFELRRDFNYRTCLTLNTVEKRRAAGLFTQPHHLGQDPSQALVATNHRFPSEEELEEMVKETPARKRELMEERARLERERKAKVGGLEDVPLQALADSPLPVVREKVVDTLLPRRVEVKGDRNPRDKIFLSWEPTRADQTLKSKAYRATFVEDYLCSTEVNVEDEIPDFLAHSSKDICRSWTLDLHKAAEKQDCYDNMRSATIHCARAAAFLTKTSTQLSSFHTSMLKKSKDAFEAKKSANGLAKETERKISILEGDIKGRDLALIKEQEEKTKLQEEIERLKSVAAADANYAYISAYIDAIRVVLKADDNADLSGLKADLEEYMATNMMADGTAFDAKDLERKGILFPDNVLLMEPEGGEDDDGGEVQDVGSQAEKDDAAL
ncbi:hypothetical protein ACS0TY_035991 [Phlomoides rotata]